MREGIRIHTTIETNIHRRFANLFEGSGSTNPFTATSHPDQVEDYHVLNFNKLLQAYAGSNDGSTVKETQDLERLNRIDFHTFVLSKKILFEERNPKK